MAESRRCPPRSLEEFAIGIFEAMGADREVAVEVAHHLVQANLSGHDSHGVLRIPQYVSQADQGLLIPAARPTILRETSVTALIDAGRGIGHFSTAFALDWAVRQARQHGLAAAAVRHSTHIGRLGEYTERAASQSLIALVTVGVAGPGVGGMVLPGTRSRFFGANPWSIGVPALDRPPMIFDGSTSMIAEGKVRFARAQGSSLPPGCIQDKAGNPSTDPEAFYAGGALLPLGGAIAGHKGYGLALASALMGGLAQIDDAEPTLAGASVLKEVEDSRGRVAGVFLSVISPGSFGDAESYQTMVAETLAAAERMPAAPGSNGVMLPGEPERRARRQREHEGIAVPEPVWQELAGVAKRFDVLLPSSL